MCLSQNMHTHSQTLTRTTHAKNTHSEKLPYSLRESFTCNLKLLVSPLLFFFHSLRTQPKDLKSLKKRMLSLLRAPNLAKRGGKKEAKLKALFHKTTATMTHEKQILLSKYKSERCVCRGGGGGEHANNNNVIDTMKTNESL